MTHIPNYNKDDVRKLFEELAKDPYSYLWHIVGDFEINGHEVKITSSGQMYQVIIDHVYTSINNNYTVVSNGREFKSTDYAMCKLGFNE